MMRRTETVFVENIALYAFHGAFLEENRLGQKFFVDIECRISRDKASSDTMADAVDYGKLCDLAHEVSGGGPFKLIETLAERLGGAVLEAFPTVRGVRIRVRKPNAPVRHVMDHVGVEITLERDA